MTARQVRDGRRVRLVDPVGIARRLARPDPAQVIGIAGVPIPRARLDEPGMILAHGDGRNRHRVLVWWDQAGALWFDAVELEVVLMTSQYTRGQRVEAFDSNGTRTWRPAWIAEPAPYPRAHCDGAYILWADRPADADSSWSSGGWHPANSIRTPLEVVR